MGVGAFAALLVIGLILLLAGTLGFGFSDPFSDPAPWTALIVVGALMMIGGIIFLVVKQVTVKH